MSIIKICLAILMAGTFVSAAHAEDDFLDLLGGEGAKKELAAPKKSAKATARVSQLRKLVTGGVGQLSAEQNIFLSLIDQNDWEKALYQWPSAFETDASGKTFAKTPTGRALKALVLYKNGVEVYALESLLSIDSPAKISKDLIAIWNETAPSGSTGWQYVNVGLWKPTWTELLGAETEIRVRGRATYGAEQVATVKELIKKSPENSRERAWLEWQLVLATALGSSAQDSANAAKALAVLMRSPANPVSPDLLTLTAARMLYQNGFLDAAVKYYEKIPKASEDWFDAQEELGWAYIRKGEPQNTIAITKTLIQPEFAAEVGPESLFLRTLAELKVCDYPEVSKTLNTFRDRYKVRAKNLLALTENADVAPVQNFMKLTMAGPVRAATLGADAIKLPRFITRDEAIRQSVLTQKQMDVETQRFAELYSRSLTGGTAKIGFQAELEDLKKQVEARARAARSASLTKIKNLAEDEVNEISQILQRLHIVEAEVIQQISLADRIGGATSKSKVADRKGSTGYQGADRIRFPAEDETWFDELAQYQVDLKKGCQAIKN